MESIQLLASVAEIESHNQLLNGFFNSIIENVYELLIQNEFSSNIYSSDIESSTLKICQDHPQYNLQNLISLKHHNYYDLHLIESKWRKCYKFNIPLLCNFIENKIIELPPPFVVLKLETSQLKKYLNDDKLINEAFANMKIIFEPNDRHKIKICKFYKKMYDCHYIIIFFDSLNYNETHILSNHDVIINLNDYDSKVEVKAKKTPLKNWLKNLFKF